MSIVFWIDSCPIRRWMIAQQHHHRLVVGRDKGVQLGELLCVRYVLAFGVCRARQAQLSARVVTDSGTVKVVARRWVAGLYRGHFGSPQVT